MANEFNHQLDRLSKCSKPLYRECKGEREERENMQLTQVA